jgi:hypothetical protein
VSYEKECSLPVEICRGDSRRLDPWLFGKDHKRTETAGDHSGSNIDRTRHWGFRHSSLFVRLAENGNVEWDELEWDPAPKRVDPKVVDVYKNVRKVATISSDRVAFMNRWLGSLDLQGIQEKMGPYNGYIDSNYEIQVRMAKAVASPMVFSVSNPWCGEGETCFNSKPLPSNLSLILCEISRLRAEATHEPVENSCRGERERRS